MGEMKHIWEWVYGRLLKLRGISMRLLERHKASPARTREAGPGQVHGDEPAEWLDGEPGG